MTFRKVSDGKARKEPAVPKEEHVTYLMEMDGTARTGVEKRNRFDPVDVSTWTNTDREGPKFQSDRLSTR